MKTIASLAVMLVLTGCHTFIPAPVAYFPAPPAEFMIPPAHFARILPEPVTPPVDTHGIKPAPESK